MIHAINEAIPLMTHAKLFHLFLQNEDRERLYWRPLLALHKRWEG